MAPKNSQTTKPKTPFACEWLPPYLDLCLNGKAPPQTPERSGFRTALVSWVLDPFGSCSTFRFFLLGGVFQRFPRQVGMAVKSSASPLAIGKNGRICEFHTRNMFRRVFVHVLALSKRLQFSWLAAFGLLQHEVAAWPPCRHRRKPKRVPQEDPDV